MTEENYMEELAIDLTSLHEEWRLQPQLYMKYSELSAGAQRNRDKAKEKLDIVKAELDDRIRSDPKSFGAPLDKNDQPKLTEAWISATILLQPEYSEVSSEIIAYNYELNIYNSAVRAFDHRKKALEKEVDLWIANYYSLSKEPATIAEGKRLIDSVRDESSQTQRQALQRSRKRKET